MFLGLALLLTASAQPSPRLAPAENPVIIVTGERISDLRARLDACIARACPTNEDVDASLALAEGQFLQGDYDAAVATIGQSLRRNRRHGAQHPEPVADLYRANARVMRHRGRDSHARQAIRRTLEVLREGIKQEDHRHFTARLEIVDMQVRMGNLREASSDLTELAARAAAAGRDDVRRLAEMRRLRVDYFLAPARILPRIRRLARDTDPDRQPEAISARLLLAAILRMEGNTKESDRLLTAIPRGRERQLLYTPPIHSALRNHLADPDVPLRVSKAFDDAWIDVGYWIDADGRVGEVEVLRNGASPSWAEPLLHSIRSRIFSASADGEPSYRVERYTLTAPLEIDHGGRGGMGRRAGAARIEVLDLTT